ncbi:NAD(P)H-dependent glycerol-3-phosphate dehydrogenase [Xanthobacter sp. TB0139]|uniref:NAD(P)H-dependent glycerol-3-phosphate dehydrogenase n=1 Tax=Xanthobacter sp. TB0139 TaxID=3459178 RepID=UPI004039D24B
MKTIRRLGVVGAGAWGTALANAGARAGLDVVLQGRDAGQMADMAARRANVAALPGIALADAVEPVTELSRMAACDVVLLVVPAQACRGVMEQLAACLAPGTPVVSCAKGIERGTGAFMSEVIAATAPQAVPAVLSGPSFAADVAAGLPTAVTLAMADEEQAQALAQALGSSTLRLYYSTDMRGVEIGGATKNVLAIAAGIVAGRQLGASARAALVSRGFAELMRFALARGARPETVTGLSGLGDLILTTSGPQSRNFAFGEALGAGRATADKLAEGAFTAAALMETARAHQIDMPVSAAVDDVLSGRLSIDAAIEALMARPQKAEG